MGRAAVWLTAAAVRSCELVNLTDTLLKQGGDGLKGGGRSGSVGIEVQSTMGKWESGRMQVVLAIGQREKRMDCNG